MAERISLGKVPFFLDYLEDFWKEGSNYLVKKRLVDKKPLSAGYVKLNRSGIKKYVKTYKPFSKLLLSDLKPGIFEDWKLWMLKKGIGVRRINTVLQAMSVAVKDALYRGDIKSDPFLRVKQIPYKPKEKGILNNAEIETLLKVKDKDPRVTLAVLLAMLTGLRRGEVRGLRWGDIDKENGLINVQHNYIDSEGLKSCKWGSDRRVLLPTAVFSVLQSVRSISPYTEPQDYVFFSLTSQYKPFSVDIIRKGFIRMLGNAGINREEQKKRNLTFHGMRHTFVTMARMAGLPDITVQALAGHKSAEMMDRYSHAGQVIDFKDARQKLERTVS